MKGKGKEREKRGKAKNDQLHQTIVSTQNDDWYQLVHFVHNQKTKNNFERFSVKERSLKQEATPNKDQTHEITVLLGFLINITKLSKLSQFYY